MHQERFGPSLKHGWRSFAIAAKPHHLGEYGFLCAVFDEDVPRYSQLVDIHVGAFRSDWRFQCEFCEEATERLYLSWDSVHFACVRCHTALDDSEAARFNATLKAVENAGKREGAA